MFSYCNNNPINLVDSTGNFPTALAILAAVISAVLVACSAASGEVLVMSNSKETWMESSKTMGKRMKSAIGAGTSIVVATSTSNFSESWNKTTASTVVIHTHGTPDGFFGEGLNFTTSDAKNLHVNSNIQLVLITACEAGGNNGDQANIGQLISQKISPDGIVVCCTTKVSGGDKDFSATNGGCWVVYQNGEQITADLNTTISMQDVADLWKRMLP